MSDHPTPERILQTGFAFWPSKTLLSAIEMGVFTELARGAESFEAFRLVTHSIAPRRTGVGSVTAADQPRRVRPDSMAAPDRRC